MRMTMTRRLATTVAGVFLSTVSLAAIAGMPSDYGATKYDEALENAKRDGKPVMVYFGEDW